MKIKSVTNLCFVIATLVAFQNCAFAQNKVETLNNLSCAENSKLQTKRSNELMTLIKTDQTERAKFTTMTPESMILMAKKDLVRRKRVGEIFAEGCIKTPQDYQIAALIFQHGDIPDHYYQSYIWASKAGELGDKSAYNLASLAIDRYLVSIGKKQLFGSQYYSTDMVAETRCFCMQPVEPSFSDAQRVKYAGRSLDQSYELLASFNKGKNCPTAHVECKTSLKPTLKGSMPGIW